LNAPAGKRWPSGIKSVNLRVALNAEGKEHLSPETSRTPEALNSGEGPHLSEAVLNGPDGDAATQLILHSLDEDQADDIVAINVRGKSAIADMLIIASGRSSRHVGAMADHLLRRLKEAGVKSVKAEGMPNCDWVLVDAGDVIVHLFKPDVRAFYNIERIWTPSPALAS
jgi:ribosome-associated protein